MRMGTEKVAAYTEAMAAMTAQLLRSNVELMTYLARQWWTMWWQPGSSLAFPKALQRQLHGGALRIADKGITPVHRRAVANARRLCRV